MYNLSHKELWSEEEKESHAKYMQELKEHVDDFDPDLINTDETSVNDEMEVKSLS